MRTASAHALRSSAANPLCADAQRCLSSPRCSRPICSASAPMRHCRVSRSPRTWRPLSPSNRMPSTIPVHLEAQVCPILCSSTDNISAEPKPWTQLTDLALCPSLITNPISFGQFVTLYSIHSILELVHVHLDFVHRRRTPGKEFLASQPRHTCARPPGPNTQHP